MQDTAKRLIASRRRWPEPPALGRDRRYKARSGLSRAPCIPATLAPLPPQIIFPAARLRCARDSNFYCPATPLTKTATLIGANNPQVVETFAITNADVDFGNADFSALPGLSGPYPANLP